MDVSVSAKVDDSVTERISPYQGLIPYSEEDAPFFFGREKETRLIIANLFASSLTLLYGASGVGKSSVLRAGVAYNLRERDDVLVVAFNSWQSEPVAKLKAEVTEAALRAGAEPINAPASATLAEFLAAYADGLDRRLMIVLDQFEEYFLYHPKDDEFGAEFPAAVMQADAPVSFLLSMREDSLAKMDRFEGRIPTLFDNYLRIEHLDRDAAREAIVKPIEQFNRSLKAGEQAFNIEPELVETVLEQVEAGKVRLGTTGRGTVESEAKKTRIETPYLQLVMSRLWQEEVRLRSNTLRLATLKNLGETERIVRTHLDTVMGALPQAEQDVAAGIFHYLVTPSGSKIAHTAPNLAAYTEYPPEKIAPVLDKLSRGGLAGRILRTVDPPLDQPDEPRYEVFHDVLALAILDWRGRYVIDRKVREDRRRMKVIAGAALMVVVVIASIVYLVQSNASRYEIALKINDLKEQEKEQTKDASQIAELNNEIDELSDKIASYEQYINFLEKVRSQNVEERKSAVESLDQLAKQETVPNEIKDKIIETGRRNQDLSRVAISVIQNKPDTSQETGLKPRVYIHIQDEEQRKRAREIESKLEAAGFDVPDIEIVGSRNIKVSEIRYFRDADESKANQAVGILQNMGISDLKARFVSGSEKSTKIRPQHYELWFSADALK